MEEEGGRKLRPDPFAGDCEDGGGLGSRIPTYIDDIPTKTTDPGVGPRCNHGLLPMTRIAFEGDSTGRRFLGSPFEEDDSGYVYWIDPKWPPHLEIAPRELWQRYDAIRKLTGTDVRFLLQDLKEAIAEKEKSTENKMSQELEMADLRFEMDKAAKQKHNNMIVRSRLQAYDHWLLVSVTVAVTLASVLVVALTLK